MKNKSLIIRTTRGRPTKYSNNIPKRVINYTNMCLKSAEFPTIEQQTRHDIKADISLATGYLIDEISITTKEALSGNIKYHYGDLDLRGLTLAEKNRLRAKYPNLIIF